MTKKVLIVDDSLHARVVLKEALTKSGFDVVGMANNGETAIDMAISLMPDIITLDNILPDMLGRDVLRAIKEEGVTSKVVVISAIGQESEKKRMKELGADAYIVKPILGGEVLKVLYSLA